MDLRQLRAFVAVAEELHFRIAAERVGMAQAAVSSKIKDLEGELGFKLFFRTTRHVSLTQAGAVFLESVRNTLNTLENGVSAASAAAENRLDRLRIGGIDGALIWYLPPILKKFTAKFPSVSLTMTEATSSEDQIKRLESHHIDIAFFRPTTIHSGHNFELLLQERVYVVLPRDHRLANRPGAISITELENDPVISYPIHARPQLNRIIMDGFGRAGIRPNIIMEVIDKSTTMQLVARGIGVAFVPEWMGTMYMPNLPLKPLAEEDLKLSFGVAWREYDLSESLREFLIPVRERAKMAQDKLDEIWASRLIQTDWTSRLDIRSWDEE
jgi:DNA-binding transcriptional LysR family regulator|tara:strand:+ start:6306 stop:7286 length:981 start_codon:yes stop_codon:yes gene_type:complete